MRVWCVYLTHALALARGTDRAARRYGRALFREVCQLSRAGQRLLARLRLVDGADAHRVSDARSRSRSRAHATRAPNHHAPSRRARFERPQIRESAPSRCHRISRNGAANPRAGGDPSGAPAGAARALTWRSRSRPMRPESGSPVGERDFKMKPIVSKKGYS